MPSGFQIFVIAVYCLLGISVLGILAKILISLLSKRASAEDMAERLGLEVRDTSEATFIYDLGMNLFEQGPETMRVIKRYLAGEGEDLSLHVLDYSYFRNNTGQHNTIIILQGGALDLPEFVLRPKRKIRDWFGEKLGGQDIDFPDDPDFNKRFVLFGENKSEVRRYLNREVREFLVENPDLRMEANGNALMSHRGKILDVDEIEKLLELSRRAAGSFAGKRVDMSSLRKEIGGFLMQSPPRRIPRWARVKVNESLARGVTTRGAFIPCGVLLLVGIMTTLGVFFEYHDFRRWLGIIALLPGSILTPLLIRARQRPFRLLSRGHFARGEVEKINETGAALTGNRRGTPSSHSLEYRVVVSFETPQGKRSGSYKGYGEDVDIAVEKAKKNQKVGLLYNPDNVDEIMLVDSLIET